MFFGGIFENLPEKSEDKFDEQMRPQNSERNSKKKSKRNYKIVKEFIRIILQKKILDNSFQVFSDYEEMWSCFLRISWHILWVCS